MTSEDLSSTGKRRGVLNARGSLQDPQSKKKYTTYFFNVEDGLLYYYAKIFDPATQYEEPIDVIILKKVVVTELKKEEANHKFTFQIVSLIDKKWKLQFSAVSEVEKQEWKTTMEEAIQLASPKIFTSTIKDACLKSNQHVPVVMETIIENLRNKKEIEGIFRISGQATTINKIKQIFDNGSEVDLSKEDVHTLTGILKLYLREVVEPLIPFSKNNAWVAVAGAKNRGEEQDRRIKELIAELPKINRIALGYLMRFLQEVALCSSVNKMETSNLAIVFGPTILRTHADTPQDAKSLSQMNSANIVTEILISKAKDFFPEENIKEKLIDAEVFEKNRIPWPVSGTEKFAIRMCLDPHHEEVERCFVTRVFARVGKAKKSEERILVVGQNRIYVFFRGGKLETEAHYLELYGVTSTCKRDLELKFNLQGKEYTILLKPISYASFDLDLVIKTICRQYELNFRGISDENKFVLDIGPLERKNDILSRVKIPDSDVGCGGFVRTYITVCDHFNTPVLEEITWDLDNLFYNNDVRSFNVSEFIHKDKYPNLEFQSLIFSLNYNTWFKSLIVDGEKIGPEGVQLIADLFKTNSTLEKLVLRNVGATKDSFVCLAESFARNKKLNLKYLDFSGNSIEDKGAGSLSKTFETWKNKIHHLDVSDCSIKKGMTNLLSALQTNKIICDSLQTLNISNNRLDNESSRKLGSFLGKATDLKILKMASTSPNFLFMSSTLEKSASLQMIDISQNKINDKLHKDLILFLTRLPSITDLKMSNTQIPANILVEILKTNTKIETLDISDLDLGDDGVISFCHYLTRNANNLKNLEMNRIWGKKSKSRPGAVSGVATLLELCSVEKLFMAGGPKSQLKKDILPLVFYMINNKMLQILDISGHQVEDSLAVALAKVLQHNKSLHTLYWDDNLTTVNGLKVFKIGLERNRELKKMPLPLMDMSKIIRLEPDPTPVIKLANEIQNKVFDNALASNNYSFADERRFSESLSESQSDKEKPEKSPAAGQKIGGTLGSTTKDRKIRNKKPNPLLKKNHSEVQAKITAPEVKIIDEQKLYRASTLFMGLNTHFSDEQKDDQETLQEDDETANLKLMVQGLE